MQVCGDASEYMQVASGEYVENRQNKTGNYKRIVRGSQKLRMMKKKEKKHKVIFIAEI